MREPRTNGSSEPHRHPQRCDGSSPDSGRRGLGPNEDDRCQRTDEDHHTEGLYSELKDSPVAVTVDFPGGVATDITGNSGVRTPEVSGDTGTAAAKLATPMDAAQQIVHGFLFENTGLVRNLVLDDRIRPRPGHASRDARLHAEDERARALPPRRRRG